MERCDVPRCRAEASVIYLGHGVCETHWSKLADDASPSLREVLGIPAAPVAAMEEAMEPTTSKTSTKTEAPAGATSTKKNRPPKKGAAPQEPRPKHEKVVNPVVFAFRLSEAERTRIHDAAGSGKASGFILAAALAAADGDLEAFKRVVGTRTTK